MSGNKTDTTKIEYGDVDMHELTVPNKYWKLERIVYVLLPFHIIFMACFTNYNLSTRWSNNSKLTRHHKLQCRQIQHSRVQ